MVGEQQLAVATPYRVFFCNLSSRPRIGARGGIPREGLRWMPRLGDVEPRERAGAKTGRRYEYQYERAARRALELLDHQQKHVCVYCDWHDDFVVESGDPPTRYVFHQVKGRKSGTGPWSFRDFFGVTRRATRPLPTSASVAKDAIFPSMLLHYKKFPDTCDRIAFVTNTGVEPELESFINAVKAVDSPDRLGPDDQVAFDFLALAYLKKTLAPSREILFHRLRSVLLFLDEPHLDDENVALTELVDLIEKYSEINLVYAQSKNIARELIGTVRLKAHHDKTIVPATEDQLRRDKGIVLNELLGLLSLSADAYEELRNGRASVDLKTLSRIQRYCERVGAPNELTAVVCRAKGQWEAWRTVARHSMDQINYISLVDKAKAIVAQNYTLRRMSDEAKLIAKDFEGLTPIPLEPHHVLGLMFAEIADTEPTSTGR